jgi:hypothetical protein
VEITEVAFSSKEAEDDSCMGTQVLQEHHCCFCIRYEVFAAVQVLIVDLHVLLWNPVGRYHHFVGRWRQLVPPDVWCLPTRLCSIIAHKTIELFYSSVCDT